MSKKNIFAISGSLRSGSSNHAILRFLADGLPSYINYTIYDNLATVPPFDPNMDQYPLPKAVTELRALIARADAIIICTPEYAFGVPGQLKNTLDWLVSSGSLADKLVAFITASSVGTNAHSALGLILRALSANITNETSLLIPFIRAKIDTEGRIIDEAVHESLEKLFNEVLIRLTFK